jgi:hypothetical protein
MTRQAGLRLVIVVSVLAALLALPRGVWAGGIVVSLNSEPTNVQAGVPFKVGFKVLSMHGSGGVPGLTPAVVAMPTSAVHSRALVQFATIGGFEANVAEVAAPAPKGEAVVAMAQPEGEAGQYVATLTLPTSGEWSWQIQPFGQLETGGALVLTPLQVSAVSQSPAIFGGLPELAPVLPLVGVLLALSLLAWMTLRVRRRAVARP